MPDALDLTYQRIPDYDDTEHVVAGWKGDDFQYFVTFSKMPPGWLDADAWMTGFIHDLGVASEDGSLEVQGGGAFRSGGGFDISYIGVTYILRGEQEVRYQLVYFITDGRNSYLSLATRIGGIAVPQFEAEVKSILESTHHPSTNVSALIQRSEDRYFGFWVGGYAGGKKGGVDVIFELKDDMTFSRKEASDGERNAEYTGVWSISGDSFSWTYLYAEPATQEGRSTETDTISSFDGDTLILVSEDGQRRLVMQRSR
ncbi:MAG TPA: hypothetical protein ENK12_12410 [Gammaproteobacteria bacterium]|nr:hypothetical protein [Gammaproteobacteria bacterium]